MTEYIKKQAAIEQFKSVAEQQTIIHDLNRRRFEFKDIVEVIGRIPPADVKPVVLCKDCDLWNEWDSSGRESLGTYRCSCAEWTTEITTYYTGPDEFCSRGVKRDSDG